VQVPAAAPAKKRGRPAKVTAHAVQWRISSQVGTPHW
jgi:hypothetical protein